MKNIYSKIYFVLIILNLSFVGCATKVSIKPFDDDPLRKLEEDSSGVVFSLPKTILKVNFTLTEYLKLTWKADAHGKPIKKNQDQTLEPPKSQVNVVKIDKPISIEPITIADPDMRFTLDTSSLEGVFIDSDVSVTLSANGLLSAVNYVVTDKTQETATALASTAINIAKIAAVAGEDVVEYVKIKDIEVPIIIDFGKLVHEFEESNKDNIFELSLNIKGKDYHPDGLEAPEIDIIFRSKYDLVTLSSDSSKDRAESGVNGIPYRIPAPVNVDVLVDDLKTQSGIIHIAQAGGMALLPLNSKFFSDSTQKIAFYENSGVLKTYQTKFSSQSEAIAGLLSNTSSSIVTGLGELESLKLELLEQEKKIIDAQKALKPDVNENIQKQIDELTKQKELLDAQTALTEAQNGLLSASPTESEIRIKALQEEKKLLDAEIEKIQSKKKLDELNQ